jgi:DNA-binding response OmpR family regulator
VNQARQPSILLVEDDALLAMDVEVVLQAAGYRVMGPAATTAEALSLLREETPDVAVLDLNLGNETSFPVFDYLARIGAPFVVLSGHSPEMVPMAHAHRSFLQKPYEPRSLLRVIRSLLDDGCACANEAS